MSSPLVDSHCHVDVEAFDSDRDEVLARARAAGLVALVVVGSGQAAGKGPRTALDLAAAHPGFVFPTVGIHPHDARFADEARLDEIARLAARPEVVAVGEIGLDFHYDLSPRPAQEEAFRRQVALARAAKKPIVVHTRLAPELTLRVLREEGARDVGGVIHCFSEDAAFAKEALDLGFVASFSGLATFPKAGAVRDAALRQPLDALLVETDAPYLAPVPHRGRRAEPAHVAVTAAFVARIRSLDEDDFRAATAANADRLFGLSARR